MNEIDFTDLPWHIRHAGLIARVFARLSWFAAGATFGFVLMVWVAW